MSQSAPVFCCRECGGHGGPRSTRGFQAQCEGPSSVSSTPANRRMNTVGARAKKPQELNQGALGFLGFDRFPTKAHEGVRQKARGFQRRIADLRAGSPAEVSFVRAPTVPMPTASGAELLGRDPTDTGRLRVDALRGTHPWDRVSVGSRLGIQTREGTDMNRFVAREPPFFRDAGSGLQSWDPPPHRVSPGELSVRRRVPDFQPFTGWKFGTRPPPHRIFP